MLANGDELTRPLPIAAGPFWHVIGSPIRPIEWRKGHASMNLDQNKSPHIRVVIDSGRLIRVSKHSGDANAVAYIVAIPDAAPAIELIRTQAAGPTDDVEDLGRVSAELLGALSLGFGQFMRLSPETGVPVGK